LDPLIGSIIGIAVMILVGLAAQRLGEIMGRWLRNRNESPRTRLLNENPDLNPHNE